MADQKTTSSWLGGLLGQSTPNPATASPPPPPPPPPRFDPSGSRYDQSTYFGRLQHFRELTDVRTLLTSQSDLREATELLARHERSEAHGASDAALWEAKRIKDAHLHPVTGEELFLPGRMSAFVPMNTLTTAAMIMARSPLAVVASQWGNQTVNSIANYVNRSGATVDVAQTAQAYGLAVGVGCGIGLGMRRLVQSGPSLFAKLGVLVPYTAVVAAGASNVALTRGPELRLGVPIAGADGGELLGTSRRAATESVKQTILSRIVLLPILPLLAPPMLMGMLRSSPAVRRLLRPDTAAAVAAETALVATSIYFALPAAIALFPQEMRIPTARLEPQFQALVDKEGKPITHVVCNKGL